VRLPVVADDGLRQRPDPDRHGDQIGGGVVDGELVVDLLQQRPVPLDDPRGDLLIAFPCRVLDQRTPGRRAGVLGGAADRLVVVAVDADDGRALAGDPVGGLGQHDRRDEHRRPDAEVRGHPRDGPAVVAVGRRHQVGSGPLRLHLLAGPRRAEVS
jgi:hypothetical protein